MTNAAALIHEGCSVYSRGRYATDGNLIEIQTSLDIYIYI